MKTHNKTSKIQVPVIITGFVLLVSTLMTTFLLFWHGTSNTNTMQTYIIGNATTSGYIGISLTYDMSPVDIILFDPDGRQYTAASDNVKYNISHVTKTITLLADSNKTGIWSAQFNVKNNNKISYGLLIEPSDTLYMDDPYITTDDYGRTHLILNTTINDETVQSIKCSLTLNKTAFSYILCDIDILPNCKQDIILDFPEHTFTGEKYTLKINLMADNGQKVSDSLTLELEKHENISSNNTSEEEDTNAPAKQ